MSVPLPSPWQQLVHRMRVVQAMLRDVDGLRYMVRVGDEHICLAAYGQRLVKASERNSEADTDSLLNAIL